MKRPIANYSDYHPLIGIIGLGILVRLALFDFAPVHADTGLFLYDGLLALQGNIPTLDYFSRSIFFHYMLAGVLWFDFSPLISSRLFMIAVSAGLGILVYRFTTLIHTEKAGFAAAAVFLLTPFSAFWGMYVKTQLAAEVFVFIGLILIFSQIERSKMDYRALFVGGMALAIAFLTRLVVLVHFGTIILFMLGYRLQYSDDGVGRAGFNAVIVGAGSTITLITIFISLGGFQNLGHFLDVTVFGLVQSQARSSVPASGAGSSVSLMTQLVEIFCPECGATQLKLMSEIILVSLPAMLITLVFWKSFIDTYVEKEYFHGVGYVAIGIGIVLWGAYLALVITHFVPPVSYILAGLSIVISLIAYLSILNLPEVEFTELWNAKVGFVLVLITLLLVAHLQRDRIFNHNYFLTFFPYVSILAGIGAIAIYDNRSDIRRHVWILLILTIAVSYLVAFIVAPFIAAPWGGLVRPYSVDGPGTVSGVRAVGADIQSRTDPGERIFTVQPIFALEADRRVVLDLSRSFWQLTFDPDSKTSRKLATEIQGRLRSGNVQYVILDRFMGNGNWSWTSLFEAHPEIRRTVANNYCPVTKNHQLYEKFDITLYRLSAAAPACNDLDTST